MGDSGNALNLDELDYDDDVDPPSIKSRESSPERKSEDNGECSTSDGEIKSDLEIGEIVDSDTDGEVFDKTEETSIFPPKKKAELPPLRDSNHIEREKPMCRYYKQGYCQYGNRCHFLHTRPNMVNIVPDKEEKINTGNYELFKSDEIVKPTRKVTPILPAKSVHLGLHRPPPPKATGETSWEKGIKQARKMKQVKDMIKRGEEIPAITHDTMDKEESGDPKNGAVPTVAVVTSRSKRARIQRIPSASPEADIKQELAIYEKVRKPKQKKDSKRWDRQQNFVDEKQVIGRGKTRRRSESSGSDSSSSSSSSSSYNSSDTFTSESSGRKTPKGYRRNGASQRRSSSEDEDYRRTRRLEAKAKGIPAAKKAKTDYRSSSSKKKPSRRKASSSSSSSSSSDESTSSDRSSRSEKKRIKLQKQLKQVEAALKAKRGKNSHSHSRKK